MERESLEFDVQFVGAGPAGLAAAIHLADLVAKHDASAGTPLPELSIAVLEKSAEVGAHEITDADPGDETDWKSQFAELNKKVGQLVNENAELRRAQEQQPQYEQPQQPPLTHMDGFDEWADQNPVQAVQWAADNKQPHLYDRAIRAWYDQDPIGAGRYERQIEQQALMQNITQQVQPQLQAAERMAVNNDIAQAINTVASRHSDFAQVVGVLDEAAVAKIMESGLPAGVLANALQGSQAEREQAIETVYRWQKAEMAGTFEAATADDAQRQADEAREAKLDAFVGSATTTTPDAVPESESDRMTRVLQEYAPSMRNAWTGRDSRQRLGR